MTTTRGERQRAGRLGLGAVLVLGLGVGGCYDVDTTPSRLAPYYGEWTAPEVSLTVSRGRIVYRNSTRSLKWARIESPFRGLHGNDIIYGGSRGRSRMRVETPPHRVGNVWKMTVEGTELQRR